MGKILSIIAVAMGLIGSLIWGTVAAVDKVESKVNSATSKVVTKIEKSEKKVEANSDGIEKLKDNDKDQDYTLHGIQTTLQSLTKTQEENLKNQKTEYEERYMQQQALTDVLKSLKKEIDEK